MDESTWGIGETRELSDVLDSYQQENERVVKVDEFRLADDFAFPLEFIYQVTFVTGMRGSGKSWTAGVLMEEFERLGLQFVCFDPLDAHGHLSTLPGIQKISPKNNETVNCTKLVSELKTSNSCLIIDISNLTLDAQQEMIADYCEALIAAKMGKGLLTIFEECQDFVPLRANNAATAPIIRLCKLGRALGYGVCMVSQRPAAITKEALSQASTYIVHNIMQTRDLIAIKDQISYGTDKEKIDKLIDGIAFAQSGECIIYSPEFLKDEGFLWIGKIRGDRRTEHKGKNIEVRPQNNLEDYTTYDIVSPAEDVSKVSEYSTLPASFSSFEPHTLLPMPVEPSISWAPPVKSTEPTELVKTQYFAIAMIGGFSAIALSVFTFLKND